jgi:hypothetical protein
MSWQATTWAMNQKVGNSGRKLLLLAIANYADENGVCWPSQGRLARDTEASLDTVQRQTKKLVADYLLRIERPPKRRGQWQTFIYHLNFRADETRPQNAAGRSGDDLDQRDRSDPPKSGPLATGQPATANPYGDDDAARLGRTQPATVPQHQAAPETKPCRIAMRPNPSRKYSIEPSGEPSQQQPRAKTAPDAADRRVAWHEKQNVEVIQNRIAQRLGTRGWSILVELCEADLDRLTGLERSGWLTDETLRQVIDQQRASTALRQSG